jgi:hypothetical protein
VIAIEPVTPVLLSTGVSINPNGAAGALTIVTVTCAVLAADAKPAGVTVTVAVDPFAGAATPALSETDSAVAPDPLAGDTCSQLWFDVAVQATGFPLLWEIVSCCAAVELSDAPVLTPMFSFAGETPMVGSASCETVTVFPATVTVPDRLAPVLTAEVNESDPLPLRPVPFVTVNQLVEVVAVQAQLLPVVTATTPVPADAAIETVVGATV